MCKKWSLGFILLLCVCSLWAKDIVIYHTSDIHGQYFGKTDDNGKPYGGFARLASVLKNTKKPFLLLDSGDYSSGSYEANISDGKYFEFNTNLPSPTRDLFSPYPIILICIRVHTI